MTAVSPSQPVVLGREPRRTRVIRRVISIPVYSLLWLVCVVGLPVLLPLTAIIDVARRNRRLAAVRCYLLVVAYLSLELTGVVLATAIWARPGSAESKRRAYERLQSWWAARLHGIGRRSMGMRVTVTGSAEGPPGPVIVFARHVSILDAVLPMVLVGHATDRHLRYVLRSILAWDPCLDIVGSRLTHSFVRKGSGQTAREVGGVVALLDGLRPDEGVTIFVEGGLTTPGARERLRRRLEEKGDVAALESLARYRELLPPRPGGPFALLAANRGADIVFLAHTGYEGGGSIGGLLEGVLVGRDVRVRLERVPFAEVPSEPAAQVAWLNRRWLEMDAWVTAALDEGTREEPA